MQDKINYGLSYAFLNNISLNLNKCYYIVEMLFELRNFKINLYFHSTIKFIIIKLKIQNRFIQTHHILYLVCHNYRVCPTVNMENDSH